MRSLLYTMVFAFSTSVAALPVTYSLTLEIDALFGIPSDPIFQIGNVYTGSFTVDDSLLLEDGVNITTEMLDFSLAIETYLWDSSMPFPLSDFAGFRSGNGFDVSPGFEIVDGEIVSFRGGVYGTSDFPYVDFETPSVGPGRFFAGLDGDPGDPVGYFEGTFSIERMSVAEPGTLALVVFGLVLSVFGRSRRSGA